MMGAVLFIDLSIPLGVAGGVPYIVPILAASFIFSERQLLLIAIGCSTLTIVGWVASPSTDIASWTIASNRLIALFAIWMTALLMVHRNRLSAKKELAQERIQVLEGLLPICSVCKKIRDQSNQWLKLERYISNHSQARFSHGYCPDCEEQCRQEFKQYKAKQNLVQD